MQVLLGKHGLVDDQLQTLVDYGLGRNASLPISSLDLRCNKLSPFAGPALKKLISFTSTLQVSLSPFPSGHFHCRYGNNIFVTNGFLRVSCRVVGVCVSWGYSYIIYKLRDDSLKLKEAGMCEGHWA
jgi:hypothetical protein